MKCNICGARNILKHTPQQELYHALKVLWADSINYLNVTYDSQTIQVSDIRLQLISSQFAAKAALKRYKGK